MDSPDRCRNPEPGRRVTPWQARILNRIARLLRTRPAARQQLLMKELTDGNEAEENHK